jgi:fructose-1,6-bisphosphatase II
LALELVRVTEAAALAGAFWLGKGDKNAADQACAKSNSLYIMPFVMITFVWKHAFHDLLHTLKSMLACSEACTPIVQAAVDMMRKVLGNVEMDGVVIIGEGEKDEAPMLYCGASLQKWCYNRQVRGKQTE